MSGLVDLLFFGLIIWFVLRAVGRATEGMRETDAGAGEEEPRRQSGVGIPGEVTQRPRPDAAESRLRRRLMDELQRWEGEQRRRTEPSSERAQGLPAPAPRRSGSVIGPEERPAARRPRPPGRARPAAAADDTPRVRPSPATRPAPGPEGGPLEVGGEDLAVPVPHPRAEGGGGLPDLSRLGPLQRAIVLTEILGPPAGTRGG